MKKLFLVTALLFFGCAKAGDPGTVNLRLKHDLTTLDPAMIVDVDGGRVAAKLFNGLVRYDENLKIVGDLTEKWDISDDGRVYRFWLRPGVVFVNGRPLEAQDVRHSFERVLDEKTLSPRRWALDKIESIETPDAGTVLIRLKEPHAPFLELLTLPSAYIIPREETERLGRGFGRAPVGTGPFFLKEWKAGTELVLERNPRYFDSPAGAARLRYRILPEDFTAVGEFERGNLDAIEIPRADFEHFQKSSAWRPYILSQTGLNTYYLGFNCKKPPFDRPEVRRALRHAVNKEGLLKQVLESRGEVSRGPLPPLLSGRFPSPAQDPARFDPAEAKELLQRTGLSLPLKARLYFNQDKESLNLVTLLKRDFAAAGVELELLPRDWSAFKEALNRGEADCFLLSWWADIPNEENFLYPTFHSRNFGGGGNRAFYSDAALDGWLDEAQRTLSEEARRGLYARAISKVLDDAPWVFLWHRKDFYVRSPRLKNFRLYPVYTMEKGNELELAGATQP